MTAWNQVDSYYNFKFAFLKVHWEAPSIVYTDKGNKHSYTQVTIRV